MAQVVEAHDGRQLAVKSLGDPLGHPVFLLHGTPGTLDGPLPRGSGEMGFYVSSEPPAPIRSMRIAADVPPAERTPIEVLRTSSATFRAVLGQRRQRHEPWFKFSPDHIDLCNVPMPVRAIPSAGPSTKH